MIHYGCVNDQLYVGSCPRVLSHVTDELKGKLGITAVINLQVLNDMERNCAAIVGKDKIKKDRNEYDLEIVETLRTVYDRSDILFMWLPITDFSTTGRELMSPQAALVLKTMLDKGHRVYVHCNAGSFRFFSSSFQTKKLSFFFRRRSCVRFDLRLFSFCFKNPFTYCSIRINGRSFLWIF